jgi:hypothetical protein
VALSFLHSVWKLPAPRLLLDHTSCADVEGGSVVPKKKKQQQLRKSKRPKLAEKFSPHSRRRENEKHPTIEHYVGLADIALGKKSPDRRRK